MGFFYLGVWATDTLDLPVDAPCVDGTVVCALRDVFDSVFVWAAEVGLAVTLIGFVLAVSITAVRARRPPRVRPTARLPRKRRVSAPVHTDGAWVRLVEDEFGRHVEVLGEDGWMPSTRALAELTSALPMRPPVRVERPS